MIKRTLGQVKARLAAVAGETGMSLTDARVLERINSAQLELMNEGDWPGIVDRWHILFDETTGILVLPYIFDRLMQVSVNGTPREIRSPWYEFVQYGPGPNWDPGEANPSTGNGALPWNWVDVVMDRGEVVSRYPVPPLDGPWKLRVYASVDEEVDGANPTINLQGYLDSVPVRSQDGDGNWYNGETLEIDFDEPYTETTAEFDSLTAVVKDETHGSVTLKAWNGTTEVELSQYAFNETNPSYRCYFIPALWRENSGELERVLLARCRRRFVPVEEDNDEMMISNVPAMECMLIAQWKRTAGNIDEYVAQKRTAVELMRQESLSYLGKSRTPSLTFQRGFAIGALPFVH